MRGQFLIANLELEFNLNIPESITYNFLIANKMRFCDSKIFALSAHLFQLRASSLQPLEHARLSRLQRHDPRGPRGPRSDAAVPRRQLRQRQLNSFSRPTSPRRSRSRARFRSRASRREALGNRFHQWRHRIRQSRNFRPRLKCRSKVSRGPQAHHHDGDRASRDPPFLPGARKAGNRSHLRASRERGRSRSR